MPASITGNKAYYYAELTVSTLAVAVTITSTLLYLPSKGWPGWVDLGALGNYQLVWLHNKYNTCERSVTHLSTEKGCIYGPPCMSARCRATMYTLMCSMLLPLS